MACYGDRFTVLYIENVRTSQEARPVTVRALLFKREQCTVRWTASGREFDRRQRWQIQSRYLPRAYGEVTVLYYTRIVPDR
jgi:hypothetical protein